MKKRRGREVFIFYKKITFGNFVTRESTFLFLHFIWRFEVTRAGIRPDEKQRKAIFCVALSNVVNCDYALLICRLNKLIVRAILTLGSQHFRLLQRRRMIEVLMLELK